MKQDLLQIKTRLLKNTAGLFWLIRLWLCASLIGTAILAIAIYAWAGAYDDRIPPGTQIAGLPIGGMEPEAVKHILQEKIDIIFTDGIDIEVQGERRTMGLTTLASGDLTEDVQFALEETINVLMRVHRENDLTDTINMFLSFLSPSRVAIPVTLQYERIRSNLLLLFPMSETPAQDATFRIQQQNENFDIEVMEGSSGTEFQWEPFFKELKKRLAMLDHGPIELTLKEQDPRVSKTTALEQVNAAQQALSGAPYQIAYEDQSWELTAENLTSMLAPGEDGNLTLLKEPFATWSGHITSQVNQEARDARLTVENGRVTDFIPSENGKKVDKERLREDVLMAIQQTTIDRIELVVMISKPTVSIDDVNELGIKEMLGAGTSSYKGSPVNRRANIQNGVNLLNGLLIAPGETFSLLKALAPFTTENGYLPELVIKGDKIVPELGGGLCQIGTTTFRAVMNAGLPIMERQNHSLVVSYYNDPSNGNPGTDATIYEPSPDFKFLNDTGNYILFQAENVLESQELRFTFWGTSDGRQGSYSAPIVSRWIPVGETQYVETLDLEPGVEQCQSAHIGADASFIYTVRKTSGEVIQATFESHYRPLPRLCLVGVETLTTQEGETQTESDNDGEEEEEGSDVQTSIE